MTPTEQDKELSEKLRVMIRGYLRHYTDSARDSSVYANEVLSLITADRKRVALDARAKVITDIELFVAQEASTYMNSKYTVHQHQKDYSDGIADGKNNAYSRLAQWLNRFKAQQEQL